MDTPAITVLSTSNNRIPSVSPQTKRQKARPRYVIEFRTLVEKSRELS
jgi:hypothetical protein